jgi:small-conductance mechanosensitive channel
MSEMGARARFASLAAAVILRLLLAAVPAAAQAPPTLALSIEPSGETATLVYYNRSIVPLRARVLGRGPAERAALAVRVLDSLVADEHTGPLEQQVVDGGILILVGRQIIVGVTAPDVDEVVGETVQDVADRTVTRLRQALDEAAEARRPGVWLRAGVRVVLALAIGVLLLWALARIRRAVLNRLSALAAQTVAKVGLADQHAARASTVLDLFQHRLVSLAIITLQLAVAYLVATFVLRQFPYTRPWGESLKQSLVGILARVARAVADAIPDLVIVAVIVAVTRAITRLLEPWFDAIERGAITVPLVYPETAATTRRLTNTALWLFAGALAYPFLPGSGTDAFKGVSVFVGLMLTLGSSGIVNQLMSGFMITYSRALRVGDFVKIGDVEGTILELGMLSTKVKTLRSEEITIPNAVVVSQTTTDYSRFAESVLTATFVTIGYDAPWRQVNAMLLMAAERTPGLRRDPTPVVLKSSLDDMGVKYTVAFCLEQQQSRVVTTNLLHANILDLFNEYGVQIMTPSYEGDPDVPKVVAKKDWYAAPARPESSRP